MIRKRRFLIIITTLLIAVLGTAFVGISNADKVTPAGSQTFSWVVEFSGDIEADIQNYRQMLEGRGYSEAQIQHVIDHLRPALEASKYAPVETRTFSVEVQLGDLESYVRDLREQGVSEESISSLQAEMQAKRESLSDDELIIAGCRIRTDGAEAYNAFGQLLYSYCSSIYWCYNGSVITSLDTWESHSTFWGWQFQGSTKSESGGLGLSYYILHRYATMYHFIGLYAYPDTHQGVYGDGSSWGYASP
jgi:hypothetical protein